ncbi:MAG: amidohydrolase family protein [Marinomonas sp.]
MKQIIDPHLHFFELTQGHYQWLKEEKAPFWPDKAKLRHNFHEKSLLLDQDAKLAGFVHIEAGFDNAKPWREIEWLESSCSLPFKTVAGIDLTLEQGAFITQVKRLKGYQSVVGCRHILDDEAFELLSQKSVQDNLTYLADSQLSFDLQMSLGDKNAIGLLLDLLKDLPTLRMIINHAGWPPLDIKDGDKHESALLWQEWQVNLTALSKFKQCAIKCSGWEMAERKYKQSWQHKVIRECLTAFGDKRVMLASNFPLTLLSQEYKSLWQDYFKLESKLKLTHDQIIALTSENTAYWYRLKS